MRIWRMTITLLSLFLGAYLLGGIPFGLIVAKAKGVDIRKAGSGNIGATNVGRVLGRKWGLLVFALDAAKGAAATTAASVIIHRRDAGTTFTGATFSGTTLADATFSASAADYIWLGAGVCAVLGHMFPIFAGFKGGKGVATSLGAIFGVYPYLTWSALLGLAIWGLVVKTSGYVSLGSIVAAWSVPISFIIICRAAGWRIGEHIPLLGLSIVLSIFILIRHRANLARIRAGTENKVGRRDSSQSQQ
jgi:glycerol-3-phosphate acyltransferase PlsY